MASLPSISVNKETIGLLMGVFGVISTGIGVYNWLLAGRAENAPVVQEIVLKNHEQDQRLDRTDEDRARFNENIKDLSSKTGDLKEAVVKLTTVIEENGKVTKKAEYFSPMMTPSHRPISVEVQ
jgi:hypothetical protein